MIHPVFTGRLGNVMFQIAAAYAYALRHNMDYCVPTWGNGLTGAHNNTDKQVRSGKLESETMLKYLGWFANVKRGATAGDVLDEDAYLKQFPELRQAYIKRGFHLYEENGRHEYNEIPFREHIIINGYFQSEKYFADCKEKIVELFNLPYVQTLKGWTSLHVRRGDYLKYSAAFPPIDERYLRTAMNLLAKNGFKKFMVCSDDTNWCKQNLNPAKYPDYKFEYSEGRNEFEDLTLGASCEHNIIANSSFSWWQAWLNRNPNKIVVSPSAYNWFGPAVKLNRKDIIPEGWVKIQY